MGFNCLKTTEPIRGSTLLFTKNVFHQYYGTNQDTKPHILSWNFPQIGVDQCLSFFLFATAAFFLLKGKLKDIIIHFLYKICNDTLLVLSAQSSDIASIAPNCP